MSTSSAVPPTRRPASIAAGPAALIGVVAVAAALGAGHLVAGLASPGSSPFLAVGDAAVRFAPQWLVEFAKAAFGTADKPVLLAGMAAVLVAAAVGAGLASRRETQPGIVAVVVLGLLGAAAVLASPAFTPVDLLAPAAAIAAGITTFRLLHRMALAPERPDDGGMPRRTLLVGVAGAVGFGALAAGGLGQALGSRLAGSRDAVTATLRRVGLAERAPALPQGVDFPELGTPTFMTSNADFYRIDTALRIPTQTADDWSLRLHGMVDREITLSFADLLARPLVERRITMICVSNEVGGSLISTADFVGVDLREILLEAGIRPGADQVLSTSSDRLFTAGTPVDVLLEPDRGALLAIGMNGDALPPEHGFPVRMVVPGLYGFVSATKWVTDLEVTTFDVRQSYWRQRGWAERSPVKTQSRIDTPGGGESPQAGRVPVAGIAWSQPTGIGAVQVRVDGRAWQDAELATEVSGDTWRMWRAPVDLDPGSHTLQVRAADATGAWQTEQVQGPVPDGATGYHTVTVRAS